MGWASLRSSTIEFDITRWRAVLKDSDVRQHLHVAEEVAAAIAAGKPVVALETAVVTHGLPEPHNVDVVRSMERIIRECGAVPATCLVSGGSLCVGASLEEIEAVAHDPRREKASVRDLGAALVRGIPAGLTVSATLFAAHLAGIRVFATGGIGGVHAGATETGDISADLPQLARTPIITVCAGAKSVLDIPRTLEFLETFGVPVFSYRQEAFPAFYLRDSGMTVPSIASTLDAARIAQVQWALGHETGILVGNPIPAEHAVSPQRWQGWLREAERNAARDGIRGKDVTPYLLAQVAAASNGETVLANIALLESNAGLAAQIAVALAA